MNTIEQPMPTGFEKVDRDIPNLKTTKKNTNISKIVFFAVLLFAIAAIAGGTALFMQRLEKNKREQSVERAKESKKTAAALTATPADFEAVKRRIKLDEANMPAPASALPSASAPETHGMQTVVVTQSAPPTHSFGGADNATVPMTPMQRRLSGDVLVKLGNDKENPFNSGRDKVAANSTIDSDGETQRSPLDARLVSSQLAGGKAKQRADLRFLLRRGATIPCAQKTRIDTTYPGLVTCQITKDVYSSNGSVLLIERGSEAFGEQRSALSQGQARIFVVWTRIETPSGVVADINSPAADNLGASGINGYVDDHFAKRFGGAIMLSLIGDFGQALASKSSGTNTSQVNFSNTTSAGHDMAAKSLENTINIPPTAYSNHGSIINIFVARDFDFGDVYELAQR